MWLDEMNSKQERKTWWQDETVESYRKENYGRSGREEAAKKNIWRQKGKQNKVYILLKEKPRKKKASWKVVIAKIFKLAKRMKH